MRTLLTLALAACAVAPAAAQTVYYQQGGTTYAPNVTYGRQGAYSTPYVQSQPTIIVSGQRTYSNIQPRVAYSYTPATYSQASYSQPTYQTVTYPRTYSYTVQAPVTTSPQVVYSTPTYATMPTVYVTPTVYSTPTYTTPVVTTPSTIYTIPSYSTPTMVYSTPQTIYSTPSYTTPVYSIPQTYSTPVTTTSYSQPVTWSQPTTYYSSYPTTMAFNSQRMMSYPSYQTMPVSQSNWIQPQFDNVVWSQPQPSFSNYNTLNTWSQPSSSAPMLTYNNPAPYYSQSAPMQGVIVSNPFQTQPTLNFVPSGSYDQRLMQTPSNTRGFAGRRTNTYYR